MPKLQHPVDFSKFRIGVKYDTLSVVDTKENASAALSLISQARKTIDIFTHDLEPNHLDSTLIAESIRIFIKISPNSKLRILLCDPEIVVKHGHRIVDLSRQFSSFISIRRTNEEHRATAFSLLIVDEKAVLHRPHFTEARGTINFDSRYNCRQHLEFFNHVWDISEPASELRQLFI